MPAMGLLPTVLSCPDLSRTPLNCLGKGDALGGPTSHCRKLPYIGPNCPKIHEKETPAMGLLPIALNCRKLPRIALSCSKLS